MLANINTEDAMLVPVVRNDFTTSQSGVSFTAACFAGPGKEWSLAPFQEPGDVKKNPVLAGKLREALVSLGADRLYAPSPVEFNGEIVEPTMLSRPFILGNGVLLFRNPKVPADGTFLRDTGDAGIFSAGGCGVIVAVLGERLIFAHMGRDCLIDRKRIEHNYCSRINESVVDSIVDTFLEHDPNADLREMRAWIFYSIWPEDFLHRYDDVVHAPYNRKVGPDLEQRGLGAGVRKTAEGVELDLPVVAKRQFIQRGVPESNISLEHGYLAEELPHTRRGGGRYLVAIVRH